MEIVIKILQNIKQQKQDYIDHYGNSRDLSKVKADEIKEIDKALIILERAMAEPSSVPQANELLPHVMPRIFYAEDWEGNKYEPQDINCKISDDGTLSFETKELFGLGDVPLDLEPVYEA